MNNTVANKLEPYLPTLYPAYQGKYASYQTLPLSVKVFLACLIVSALLSANPHLTCYAILVEIIIFYRLWLPGQPPVFFIGVSTQWLQSATRILQANLEGAYINDFDQSPNAAFAAFMALTALLVFSWVGGIFLRKTRFNRQLLTELLLNVNLNKALIAYLTALLMLPLLNPIRIGGLAQIIYSLQGFKWALYVVLVLASVQQKRYQTIVIGIFLLEFILGFTGYFSQFREVLLISIIVFLTIRYKIKTSTLIMGGILAFSVFSIFVVWTGVKQNYRFFLRGGQEVKSQAVIVSSGEALEYLGRLIKDFDNVAYKTNMNIALDRLQYTQMIQRCVDYVPAQTPYEKGKLWYSAITHVFTPRILFPNKEIIDDSARARLYTGVKWSLLSEGTSISIGYIAESYVDFGRYFFWLPIVFLGILLGGVYRYFLSVKGPALLLNIGAIIPILIEFQVIERSGNKLVGGVLMAVLVNIFIIQRFFYPMLLRFLFQKSPRHSTLAPG